MSEKTDNILKLFQEMEAKADEIESLEKEIIALSQTIRDQSFVVLDDKSSPTEEVAQINEAIIGFIEKSVTRAAAKLLRQQEADDEAIAVAVKRGTISAPAPKAPGFPVFN